MSDGMPEVVKALVGYSEWKPKQKTKVVMQQVEEIIDFNQQHWPLTIRQIFYMLVANYNYDKTELAYERLIVYLGRARRAQWIPFEAIRDDGAQHASAGGWFGAEQWKDSIEHSANTFSLQRMNDQPVRVELFCETAGLVPLFRRAVSAYGVDVRSGGGFNSLTTVRETALRVVDDGRKTIILNFGDWDPSGVSIYSSFKQDVEAFVWQEGSGFGHIEDKIEFHRIGIDAEQIKRLKIETAPPKKSDSRSAKWVGETAQLEAIPVATLIEMAQEAVLEHLDSDILAETVERELHIQQEIIDPIDEALHQIDL